MLKHQIAFALLLAFSTQGFAQEFEEPTYALPTEPLLLPVVDTPTMVQTEEAGEDLPSTKPTAQDVTRSEIMAAAARKFGAISSIGSIELNGSRLSSDDGNKLPEMFAVTEADREVSYGSPPMHRPWENMVLRPHARYAHHPLYFEEPNLERYGLRRRFVQPACSAAHFFGTVAVLPYKTTLHRPHQPMFFHHPYLAGVNGCERHQPEFRLGPAVVQAGVATGLMFVAP